MRTLSPAPEVAFDAVTREPCFGSYVGSVADDRLGPLARSPLRRLATQKRWVYACAASRELFAAVAVVDLGYATSSFAFAYRHGEGLLFDRSVVGPPFAGKVRRDREASIRARFTHPSASVRMLFRRREPALTVEARFADASLELTLGEHGAPPPLTAIAPIEGGRVNLTEKRALMPVRGSVTVAGVRRSLDGAWGGLDYTHGLLARETSWRWAFLLGETTRGVPVGMNLVEGFVGEPECALFVGERVLPLAEGRFTWEREQPMRPWRVRTADGAVDLGFEPGAVHRETQDLGLVRSRFLQPIGRFSGTLRFDGETHEVRDALGVVEDQEVRW